MRVKTNDKEGFKPFDLIITLEDTNDAAKIFSLFNYSPCIDSLEIEGISEQIREIIQENTINFKYTFWFKKMEQYVKERFVK
jgi:hypothetical protein